MPLSQADLSSVDTEFDDDITNEFNSVDTEFDDDITNEFNSGVAGESDATVDTNDTDSGFRDETATAEAPAAEGQSAQPSPAQTQPVHNVPAQAQATGSVPAQRQAGGAVAPANSNMGAIEDDGLGELDIGFGSFPIVKLQDGEFQTNDVTLGQEFLCQIMQAQPKYIFKVSDNDLFYSYDKQLTTKGEAVADKIAAWKQANMKHEVKEYLDLTVLMVGGELDGTVALLSVPPTSKKRFSGYRVMCQMQHRAKATQVITRVYRGNKVQGNAPQPFYPWEFAFHAPADTSAAA